MRAARTPAPRRSSPPTSIPRKISARPRSTEPWPFAGLSIRDGGHLESRALVRSRCGTLRRFMRRNTAPVHDETPMIRKLLTLCTLVLAFAATAHADTYPSKPIHLVVPFPPGGGTDILARLMASKLSEVSKWTVVADNRAGAGGTIGIAEAARAAPSGYEMVMGQKDNMVVAPWLYKNLSYDPTKDLVAVAHVAYTPVIIVTRAESKFKTLADVVNAARAQPDAVTYGSPGNGTTIHLAGEIFKSAANIKMRHVPYKGSNAAMMDVLAGNVDLMVSSVPSAMAQIKSGKLRPLAVTSLRRSSSLPDVPSVAEQGYKDF